MKWSKKTQERIKLENKLEKEKNNEKYASLVEFAWCNFYSFESSVYHLNSSPSNFKAPNSRVSLVLSKATTNFIHDFPPFNICLDPHDCCNDKLCRWDYNPSIKTHVFKLS